MTRIGVFEAKNKLSELIDRVLKGEEFTITRHGEPVALFVSITGRIDHQQARAAALRIVKRSQSLRRREVDAKTLKEAREEGRR